MKKLSVILFASILIIISCKKKQDDPPPCVAGAGGGVTFVVYAKHNDTAILNFESHPDTTFIRYGTTVFPGTGANKYNIYFTSEAGEDHIHCPGFRCGDYYIYRTAWDSVHNITYHGGRGISISQTSGESEVEIPVN